MGKGSRARPLGVNRAVFESNWDKIFNREKAVEKSEEEGLRESDGLEYTESDNPLEGGQAYFKERGLRDAKHSIQHDPTAKNN